MCNKTKQKDKPGYNIHQTNEYKTGFVLIKDFDIQRVSSRVTTIKSFPQPRTQEFRNVKKRSAFRAADLSIFAEKVKIGF